MHLLDTKERERLQVYYREITGELERLEADYRETRTRHRD